jgi:hypothetical protein
MTQRVVSCSVAIACLAAALTADPAPAADAKADAAGFVQLFNGKDLTGWKIHPQPNPRELTEVLPKEKDGKAVAIYGKGKDGREVPLWRVEGGQLIGSGPATHLFSERGDYRDFRYRVEAQINNGGNSGQYFRTAFGPGFPRGYEAQINATHRDKIKTGSLYLPRVTQVLVLNDAPHKPDEWFTQEVTAQGNHIVITVNGKTTVDYKDPNNTYKEGHFALQGHDPGTVVRFRKIEVQELSATAK